MINCARCKNCRRLLLSDSKLVSAEEAAPLGCVITVVPLSEIGNRDGTIDDCSMFEADDEDLLPQDSRMDEVLFKRFAGRTIDRVMHLVASEAPSVPRGEVLRMVVQITQREFVMSLSELREDGVLLAHHEERASLGIAGTNSLLTRKICDLPGMPARVVMPLLMGLRGERIRDPVALVGDLVRLTEADLLSYRHVGRKTVDQVVSALAAAGLSLGMRVLGEVRQDRA